MLRLKEGDCVQIIDRPATSGDAKSGLYYNHYRNVTGKVFKTYGTGDGQQIAIEVDLDTLPEDVARRHLEVRDQMRANLPNESKKQSAANGVEALFFLRYVVLVGIGDLTRPLAPRSRVARN